MIVKCIVECMRAGVQKVIIFVKKSARKSISNGDCFVYIENNEKLAKHSQTAKVASEVPFVDDDAGKPTRNSIAPLEIRHVRRDHHVVQLDDRQKLFCQNKNKLPSSRLKGAFHKRRRREAHS